MPRKKKFTSDRRAIQRSIYETTKRSAKFKRARSYVSSLNPRQLSDFRRKYGYTKVGTTRNIVRNKMNDRAKEFLLLADARKNAKKYAKQYKTSQAKIKRGEFPKSLKTHLEASLKNPYYSVSTISGVTFLFDYNDGQESIENIVASWRKFTKKWLWFGFGVRYKINQTEYVEEFRSMSYKTRSKSEFRAKLLASIVAIVEDLIESYRLRINIIDTKISTKKRSEIVPIPEIEFVKIYITKPKRKKK